MDYPTRPRPKLPGLEGDDRLRFALVTMAQRAPAEQEAERLVGAAGQPGFGTNFSAAVGHGPPRFWHTDHLWTHLAGAIHVTGPTAGGVPFVLPSDYAPPFEQHREVKTAMVAAAPGVAIGSQTFLGLIEIVSAGRAGAGSLVVTANAGAGIPCVIFLDGIAFRSV